VRESFYNAISILIELLTKRLWSNMINSPLLVHRYDGWRLAKSGTSYSCCFPWDAGCHGYAGALAVWRKAGVEPTDEPFVCR